MTKKTLLFLIVVLLFIFGCAQQKAEILAAVPEEIVAAEEPEKVDASPGQVSSPEERNSLEVKSTIPVIVTWHHDTAWKSSSTPPLCPEPLPLQTPVDIDLATSILYPGQLRSGQYKAHGGFRFDHSHNEDITVTVPLDGLLVRGSRYREGGEIQYMFDIVNSCGIMIRFDHLLTLSPKFAKVAEELRPAVVDDSRTTDLNPIPIKTGEVIATAVGFKETGNVGVDFGVYDLRQKNKAAENTEWLEQHPGEQAAYAVCWLDWLPAEDSIQAKSLPGGDSISGKESDYCE